MSSQQQREQKVCQKYAMEVMRGLGLLRNRQHLCDLTVVTDGGKEFLCHRDVLAASSGFFNALLSSGMKEDIERRVILKGVSEETFSEILLCVYESKYILTKENLLNIWHAANQLEILFLLEDCKTFVKEVISVDNYFAIYQTSKLLDCMEITKFSWNYILREFEQIRKSDEILLLTASEMKGLVKSQDLITTSEDRVVETILRWVAYNPGEETPKSLAHSSESCMENTGVQIDNATNLKTEENNDPCLRQHQRSEQPETVNQAQVQECSLAQGLGPSSQTKDNIKTNDTSLSRVNYLASLLNASRICLVSGLCMMETVWANPMIQADQKCLDIVQEAIGYQVQTDRRHDYCPSSAIYRTSNAMENVTAAIIKRASSNLIVCRKQDGKWYGLGSRHVGKEAYSAVCFDGSIYVASDNQQMNVYNSSMNHWKSLPNSTISGGNTHLLAVGNNLYAIHSDEKHSIEMLNIKDAPDGQVQGQWINAGALSTASLIITCATTVSDKIVVFGYKDGANDTIVECFDTRTFTTMRLNDISGPPKGMVSFRKGTTAFILQMNGALWRIRSCTEPPFVEVKYETMLWDFYRDLKGAVLFNDELVLFGPSIHKEDVDEQWELTVPGVFKRIQNIPCSEDYSCFMNIAVPKKSLKALEDYRAVSAPSTIPSSGFGGFGGSGRVVKIKSRPIAFGLFKPTKNGE